MSDRIALRCTRRVLVALAHHTTSLHALDEDEQTR